MRLPWPVKLEPAGHHEDGLRDCRASEHRISEGVSAAAEQDAIAADLIANNPLASPVLADQQQRFYRNA